MGPPGVDAGLSPGFAPTERRFLPTAPNVFPQPLTQAVRRRVADQDQESRKVLRTGPALTQVRRDAGVRRGRVLVTRHELDVDMEDPHRLVAAHVGGVCLEERIELRPLTHEPSPPPCPRGPDTRWRRDGPESYVALRRSSCTARCASCHV